MQKNCVCYNDGIYKSLFLFGVWGISSVCSVHCCWDYIDCCFAGACLGAEKISGRKLGDYRKVIAFFDVM